MIFEIEATHPDDASMNTVTRVTGEHAFETVRLYRAALEALGLRVAVYTVEEQRSRVGAMLTEGELRERLRQRR